MIDLAATSCRVALFEAQLQLTKFTYCARVRFAATRCSATPRRRSRTRRKRDACFAPCREALRAQKWLAAKTPQSIFVR